MIQYLVIGPKAHKCHTHHLIYLSTPMWHLDFNLLQGPNPTIRPDCPIPLSDLAVHDKIRPTANMRDEFPNHVT